MRRYSRATPDQMWSLAMVDRSLLLALRTLPHAPAGDRLARAISTLADHGRCWAVLGITGATCDRRDRLRWLAAAAVVLATEQTGRQIKRAVVRPRPQLDGLPPLASVTSRYSFPSSHTATAVAAIYAFEGLLPRRVLIGWAALTAASRPYLGVHYPSDVAFGAALGFATGKAAQAFLDR
jgi:membrane-associated phospholipid phosphatase